MKTVNFPLVFILGITSLAKVFGSPAQDSGSSTGNSHEHPPTTGLRLWLRSDAGVETNADGMVTRWLDQSGLDKHAWPAWGAPGPAFVQQSGLGKPSLHFSGSGNMLLLPNFMEGATGAIGYIVVKSEKSKNHMWRLGNSSIGTLYPDAHGLIQDGFADTKRHLITTPTPILNEWHVYQMVSTGKTWLAKLDQKTLASSLNSAPIRKTLNWMWTPVNADEYGVFYGSSESYEYEDKCFTFPSAGTVYRVSYSTELETTADDQVCFFGFIAEFADGTIEDGYLAGGMYSFTNGQINLAYTLDELETLSTIRLKGRPLKRVLFQADSMTIPYSHNATLHIEELEPEQRSVGFPPNPIIGGGDAGSAFQGEIAEILIYDENADPNENVSKYLSAKYGLFLAADTTDSDNDGIPDAWEIKKQLNPADPWDAGLDNDADGISNLDEYRSGLDPNQSNPNCPCPDNFRVTADGKTSANLSWNTVSQPALEYELERSTNSEPFVKLADLSVEANRYRDESLAPAETYTFRIRTVDNWKRKSLWSNEITIQTNSTSARDPRNLTVVTIAENTIAIRWEPPIDTVGLANYYHISVNGTTIADGAILDTEVNDTYSIVGLEPCTKYEISVGAVYDGEPKPEFCLPLAATTNSDTITIPQYLAPPSQGLRLWLRADEGVETNTAGLVTLWRDLSQSQAHATPTNLQSLPTLIAQSSLGGPSVAFEGSGQSFNLPSFMENATGAVAYVVVKSLQGNNQLWTFGNSEQGTLYPTSEETISDDFANSNVFTTTNRIPYLSSWNTYQAVFQNGTWCNILNQNMLIFQKNASNTSLPMSYSSTPFDIFYAYYNKPDYAPLELFDAGIALSISCTAIDTPPPNAYILLYISFSFEDDSSESAWFHIPVPFENGQIYWEATIDDLETLTGITIKNKRIRQIELNGDSSSCDWIFFTSEATFFRKSDVAAGVVFNNTPTIGGTGTSNTFKGEIAEILVYDQTAPLDDLVNHYLSQKYPQVFHSKSQKDSDGDGIPDLWEITHGLDPTDPSDALLDRNNDGMDNLTEYMLDSSQALPQTDELLLEIFTPC